MFAGMSRDSGCSLIHPEPNEADTSDFISPEKVKHYLEICLQYRIAIL